jgi:hypothetical protein
MRGSGRSGTGGEREVEETAEEHRPVVTGMGMGEKARRAARGELEAARSTLLRATSNGQL